MLPSDDDLLGQQTTSLSSLEEGELDTGDTDTLGSQEQRRLSNRRRYLLADDYDPLVLVEGDGLRLIEVLAVLLGKPLWFIGAILAEDALQRGRVELRGKRGVLERLGYHVPRRAVPLQLDNDHIPLAVYTEQVDRLAEVG